MTEDAAGPADPSDDAVTESVAPVDPSDDAVTESVAPVDPSDDAVSDSRVTEYGQPEPVDRPRHPAVVILAVLLLLALFALGAAGLGNSLDSGDSKDVAVVVVPRGAGRPAAEVQKQLERLGLFVEINYASNEVAPVDTVTAQSPIAGSRLEAGKLVTLTVSDGPAGVQIPDAAGLQPIAATNLLQAIGLQASTEEVYDEKVRVGEVVETVPEAGARAPLGSSVVLRLSKGRRPRVVPEVVGVDEARAFSRIGRAELQIGKIERPVSTDVPVGTVISSSPGVGEEVPPATPVNLVIARAGDLVSVPDFVLMTKESAASLAKSLGLRTSFTSVSVPAEDTRRGIVVAQIPIAGSAVATNATVELSVGASSNRSAGSDDND